MSGKKLGKKALTLIIGFIVLLLLGGGLVYLLMNPAPTDSASSAASSSDVATVLGKTAKDVKSVEVTNAGGTYTLSKSGENYTVSSFLAPGATEVKAIGSAAKFSSTATAGFIDSLTSMTSGGTVEDGTKNLSVYGLDKPTAKVKVSFNDGSSYLLEVGNAAPDNINYYVYDKQADKVLLIANTSLTSAMNSKEGYADLTLIPAAETLVASSSAAANGAAENPVVKSFTFGGTVRPEPIVLESTASAADTSSTLVTDSGFRVVSPKKREAGYNAMNTISQKLWGITAASAYAVAPTPEQLTETGLTQPYSTMQVVYEGGQTELRLGKKTDEGYYCQTSLSDAIYLVAAENVPWVDYTAYDLYDKIAIIPNINDVSVVTVEVGGKTYRFDVGHEGESDILAKYEGKDLSSEPFRSFYRLIISAIGENPVTELPTSPTVMKFTYEYVDKNRKTDVVEFKKLTDRQMAMIINGECDFSIRSTYLDKVAASIDPMLKGEKITVEW